MNLNSQPTVIDRQLNAKYAMGLTQARVLGTQMAACGWSVEKVNAWLVNQGYHVDGLSARRLMNYYNAQIARG